MNWDELAPVGESRMVEVEHLHFDLNNPRFTPNKRPDDKSDQSIISKLASTADLSELVQAIATSGYINIEPLVVMVRDGRLIVLEGNRRLAAVKCLKNAEYAETARISIPQFDDRVCKSLKRILVYRVEKEDDARDFIGFKHVNGPQAWDAYAKAEFAGRWLDGQANAKKPLMLVDIANRMGDRHATIHRMVTALYVLRQAEQEELYSIEDRQKNAFSFSHLYTALSYEEFTEYLGMERLVRNKDPSQSPVPVENLQKLRQLLLWLYGSKKDDSQPVIRSQNPDLNRLKKVLESKAATRELEELGDLDAAVVTATPKSARFSMHLLNANAELQKTIETLEGFDPGSQPEMQEIAESAEKKAVMIRRSIDATMLDPETKKTSKNDN